MKKRLFSIVSIILVVLFVLSGCTNQSDNPTGGEYKLNVRSPKVQEIKIGEVSSAILYNVKPSGTEVTFTSSDTSVLTVDKYGEVTAVAPGTATVTVAIKDKPEINEVLTYNVSRNFFKHNKGYYNGSVDFISEDNGSITVNGEQAQILVDRPGKVWYFKTTLSFNQATGGNPGSFGVGSFLVDATHAIGNNMFWYMVWPTSGQVAYGGWRYALGLNSDNNDIGDAKVDTSSPFDMTMIRNGVDNYLIVEQNGVVIAKYTYQVPDFANYDTYPGVYGQELSFGVSNYVATNDVTEVYKQLSRFSLPTSIDISVPGDTLFAGHTYNLASVVSPSNVFDKSGKFALAAPVSGVTLEESGLLTIGADVNGTIDVIVTSNADNSITATRKFTIRAKQASTSDLFDTDAIVGADKVATDGNKLTVTAGGNKYIPTTTENGSWYMTAKVVNTTEKTENTTIGLMSATDGFAQYKAFGITYSELGSITHRAEIATAEGSTQMVYGAENNTNVNAEGDVHELGLLKKAGKLYIFADGKLMKEVDDISAEATIPALYVKGAGATISEVSVVTDEATIDNVLAANPFFVGGMVTKITDADGKVSYKLANEWRGNKNNIDWPPVNEFENGLLWRNSLKGNYTMEFTMSGLELAIVDNDGKTRDGKLTVYLRSESTSSSVHFVFERIAGSPKTTAKFTPCLNDATFTAYDLPDEMSFNNLWNSGTVRVRLVKTHDYIELYVNGVRLFEGKEFMNNHGEWGSATVCTPGVGTFACGATISDFTVKVND